MTEDELDDLFEQAERAAVAYDWNTRSSLLRLFDSSTSISNEHLEDEIARASSQRSASQTSQSTCE